MGRRGWSIILGAAALVGGYTLWKTVLSPEAKVERSIRSAADAAESVDADAFLAFFAADYRDYLNGERDQLEQRVSDGFSRVDRLNVTVQAVQVDVTGEAAEARFELVIVAFRGEERFVALGTPFQPERVVLTLRREGSEWRFSGAERDVSRPPE